MDQDSPKGQNFDGLGSFEDAQIFGIDSLDQIHNSDFANIDIDFEELLNSQLPEINEPWETTPDHMNAKHEHLDEKSEVLSTTTMPSVVSDEPPAVKTLKRDISQSLIDALSYMIEENKLLKKKLKYNNNTLESNYEDKDYLKDQNYVDLSIKSSLGLEDKEENDLAFLDDFLNKFY